MTAPNHMPEDPCRLKMITNTIITRTTDKDKAPWPTLFSTRRARVGYRAVQAMTSLRPCAPSDLDVTNHKQKRDVVDGIGLQMGLSKKTRSVDVFEGPKVSDMGEITIFNYPVLFSCEPLTDSPRTRGAFFVYQRTSKRGAASRILKAWPNRLTSERLDLLRSLLNTELGTATLLTQQAHVSVRNLNGGMWSVTHDEITVRDILHFLITEVARIGVSKPRAAAALQNIELKPREYWLAAASRLVQSYRTPNIDPTCPYLVEDPCF